MGDFSIRCAISGVPIPCGTRVYVFKLGESPRHPGYFYLVGMPTEGTMGSYGEAEDIPDFYVEGFTYRHVLPNLWRAAGAIWTEAMSLGGTSLAAEIQQARFDYARRVKECERYKGHEAYEDLIRFRVSECIREWLRRVKELVLFAPDSGKSSEVMLAVEKLVTQDEFNHTACEELQKLVAGFMSSWITGADMLSKEETHPFKQYPDLKVDLQWHEAIVAEIRRIQKEL